VSTCHEDATSCEDGRWERRGPDELGPAEHPARSAEELHHFLLGHRQDALGVGLHAVVHVDRTERRAAEALGHAHMMERVAQPVDEPQAVHLPLCTEPLLERAEVALAHRGREHGFRSIESSWLGVSKVSQAV